MKKVQFDVADEAYRRMVDMQGQLEVQNIAQVVQKALRLLEWVMQDSRSSHIQLIDKHGEIIDRASRDDILLK